MKQHSITEINNNDINYIYGGKFFGLTEKLLTFRQEHPRLSSSIETAMVLGLTTAGGLYLYALTVAPLLIGIGPSRAYIYPVR